MPGRRKRTRSFLQLTRKTGQRVIIGDPPNHVVLTLGPQGQHGTQLQFNAPRNMSIDREEIALDKMMNQSADDISTAY